MSLTTLFIWALLFFLGILSALFFSILIHELGHAIPLLILSRKKVTVFVGSFGDDNQSVHLRVARLHLWIKYNPFLWVRGLCRPGEQLSTNKTIFYIATGPLASLIFGVFLWYLQRRFDFSWVLDQVLRFAMFYSFVAFIGSIIPLGRQIYTSQGTPVNRDFLQILHLIKSR